MVARRIRAIPMRGVSLRALGVVIAIALVAITSVVPARASVPGGAPEPSFRTRRVALASGAELITVFRTADDGEEVPLVAVVNDTLGDATISNDLLRYVWVFSYTKPSVAQRIAATIPFYYFGVPSKLSKKSGAPPVVYDFSKHQPSVWRSILWYVARAAILEPQGWFVDSGASSYTRNNRELRDAHLKNALAVLDAARDDDTTLDDALDDEAFGQVYSRIVGGGWAGLFLNERQSERAYENATAASRRRIARNWELLRQRCEEEGLFFDPLPAPPARARHAIVWVAADEVSSSAKSRSFDPTFLNISSPWADERVRTWGGYTKTCYVGADGSYLREPEPGSRAVEMVPLGVYGLDFPKIPALLVDFRSIFNPKKREVSHRVLEDVARLAGITPFGNLKLFVARQLYATLVKRTGKDMDQESRAASFAQLRTLLLLRDELDPQLSEIVERGISQLNANPLDSENGRDRDVAREQYRALLEVASSGELDRRIEKDRAKEMVTLAHGRFARSIFSILRYASLGLVSHSDDSPELRDANAIDRSRRHYARLLERVAAAPRPIELTWSPDRFLDALGFFAIHGEGAGKGVIASIERIFENAEDREIRLAALAALHRIGTKPSRTILARISNDPLVDREYRVRSADLLALRPDAPVTGGGATTGIISEPTLKP
jgi:hypothetical protein